MKIVQCYLTWKPQARDPAPSRERKSHAGQCVVAAAFRYVTVGR